MSKAQDRVMARAVPREVKPCPTPAKRAYTIRTDAKRAARRIKRSAVHADRKGVYLCDCGSYHLASR